MIKRRVALKERQKKGRTVFLISPPAWCHPSITPILQHSNTPLLHHPSLGGRSLFGGLNSIYKSKS
jgi:hypothetical protein